MNTPFFIARRYLVSKKSNNAINIISWISVFAIAVGTAALVIILSFMNGLTGLVKDLYNSFDPDLEISAVRGKTFVPDSSKILKIKALPGVRMLDFSVEDNALLKYHDRQAFAVVKGVGDNFFRMTELAGQIEDGQAVLQSADGNYMILGKGLTYQLGVNIRDKFNAVSLYSPKRGNTSVFSPDENLIQEQVMPGAYFSINDEFDYKYVLVHISLAQRLFDCAGAVSTLEIDLEPGADETTLKKEIAAILGDDFVVKDRYEQNKTLFSTLQSEKLIVFMVLIFVLLVATFNIIGSLLMLMMEKQKDISTLRNLGADAGFIRKIFLNEGMLIVFSGAMVGLMLGLGFCLLHQHFELVTMAALGREIPYPMQMMWTDFALILLVVLSIGGLAAWLPVRIFTARNKLSAV